MSNPVTAAIEAHNLGRTFQVNRKLFRQGETITCIFIMLLAGYLLFDVTIEPSFTTLALVLPLHLLALSGIALLLSGVGLLIKRSNALSNLVSPFFILLGGVYYPVTELPDSLQMLARALPLGCGMEAITAATLAHASLGDIQRSVLRLAAFAVVSPLIGLQAFNYLDRLVRRRGEVDIY